jgi:enterochelin esterase-like enzyme
VLLEPQSTALFIVLMVGFCALLAIVAVARQPAVRVLAASLAFVPAMLFGVAAVNKYYDYYQTWGSVAADLSAQGVNSLPQIPASASGKQLATVLGKVTGGKAAAADGETVRLTVTGHYSRLTRTVLVYLPPQYFQPGYARRRFPAVELITGYPGQPQDWINVVGVTQTYLTLLRDGVVKPAVLVMPSANGGPRVSLQCLNVHNGPQDATFIGVDLPDALSQALRVVPSGRAWGIAGYSEGGYCAANLALLYPDRYGYSGVLSGYFAPLPDDQFGNPLRKVSPFGRDTRALARNTPLHRLASLPLNVQIPLFWLGAGSSYHVDVTVAEAFQRLLLARQPGVNLTIEPGGSHNMATWRALVPPMLEWMTPRLAAAQLHPLQYAGPSTAPRVGNVRPTPSGASPAATPSPSRPGTTRSKRARAARWGRKA